MARLPQPGSDQGQWGEILNEYLLQSHDGAGHLRRGTVGSEELADEAVTVNSLAPAVRSDLAAKYMRPASGIPESDLSEAVQTKLNQTPSANTQIVDGAVTTPKLADGAVSAAKLAGDSVTTAKLTNGVVTNAKLADDSVTTPKLADSSVATDKLVDNAVTTSKLADENVSEAKLAPALSTKINDKYDKPSEGIPETDLAQSVQDKINAASALEPAIEVFPINQRAQGVDDDATDMIREAIARLNGQPGTVRLAPGRYYIGGGTTPDGAAFVLASGQRIEGAGHDRSTNGRTVLWVDDNTTRSAHLVRSEGTTGVAVTGLTFENRGTLASVDIGRDPVYLRRCSNFDLSYNTAVPTGVGFQFDLNIKSADGTSADQWGTNGWVHDCYFNALTEFHQTHNLRVERCHWNLDRSLGRPAWLRGATQSGFKFSGSWGVVRGCQLLDCTMHISGTGERVEAFEIVRATETTFSRFVLTGDRPETYSVIAMSSSKPEHGVVEGQLTTVFRDCEFGNMSAALYENVAVSYYNCRWNNTVGGSFNAINDSYNPAQKQAVTTYPNEVLWSGCEFKGGGRYVVSSQAGGGRYRFIGCTIEYDNTVFARAVEFNAGDKTVIMDGCHITLAKISAGSPSAVTLNNTSRSHLTNVSISLAPGVSTTVAPIFVMGTGTVSLGDFVRPASITNKVTKWEFTGTITGE